MKKSAIIAASLLLLPSLMAGGARKGKNAPIIDTFPDGSPVSEWFADHSPVDVEKLGKKYLLTDHGVVTDSTVLQTEAIQRVIDLAASEGGGVIVVPEGTFLSGSLFFKPGTHLNVAEGGKLKGSDAITNYKILKTRLEGQTIDYFAALVNADGVDGFTITGPGTIDGNGQKFWDEFWLRRKVIPKCTNLDALRPRLVYISNSNDVTVSGVRLVNSGFWTNHFYRCDRVKFLDCFIHSSTETYPKAPSTDAIDLDICNDVLVRDCYINVNDDAVCLKGGKGTYVDKDSTNGSNARVIIEKCSFGKANSGLTFGSEAWDCNNVILRDCDFTDTYHVLLFKMRPDTPQTYRNVLVDNARGRVRAGVEVQTWKQFFNPLEREDMPESRVDNVTVRNVEVDCVRDFYKDTPDGTYSLSNFRFHNIKATDKAGDFDVSRIQNCDVKDVDVKGKD